jgi:nucleotide-binding universal stress UspA family protein
MRRILVPIDSSEHALDAVRFAITLARENGPLAVHLITVHEEPLVYGEIAVYVTRERMAELQQQHSDAVLAPAEAAFKAAGVEFTREIVIGAIAQGIVDCATQRGCDAIVMGSRGLGALGSIVLGSVATKVVHLASIPVILVK